MSTNKPKKIKTQWINTLTVWQWDGEKYVEVHNEGYEYSGPLAKATDPPTRETSSWQFQTPSAEVVATVNANLIGTKNTNLSLSLDTTYYFRCGIEETAGNAWKNADARLVVNPNGLGAQNVTTTSTYVQAVSDSNNTDNADTIQSNVTSGEFTLDATNEGYSETGDAGGGTADLASTGFEAVWAIQFLSADFSPGDTVVFDIVDEGDSGNPLDNYQQTLPTVTIAFGASTVEPTQGLHNTVGQTPTVTYELIQGVSPQQGLHTTIGQTPTAGAPIVSVETNPEQGLHNFIPQLPVVDSWSETKPIGGLHATIGHTPTLEVTLELTTTPTIGLHEFVGQTPVAEGAYFVDAQQGLNTLTGQIPVITYEIDLTVAPNIGLHETVGQTPEVGTQKEVLPSVGLLEITGGSPLIDTGAATPSTGLLETKGQTPSVTYELNLTLTPSSGLHEISGQTPSTGATLEASVSPSQGLNTFVGGTPTAIGILEFTLTPTVGAHDTVGQTPGISPVKDVQPTIGRWDLSGNDQINLDPAFLYPEVGTIAFSGYQIDLPSYVNPGQAVITLGSTKVTVNTGIWGPVGPVNNVWTPVGDQSSNWSTVASQSTTWIST